MGGKVLPNLVHDKIPISLLTTLPISFRAAVSRQFSGPRSGVGGALADPREPLQGFLWVLRVSHPPGQLGLTHSHGGGGGGVLREHENAPGFSKPGPSCHPVPL